MLKITLTITVIAITVFTVVIGYNHYQKENIEYYDKLCKYYRYQGLYEINDGKIYCVSHLGSKYQMPIHKLKEYKRYFK